MRLKGSDIMRSLKDRIKCLIRGHEYELLHQRNYTLGSRIVETECIWRCIKCWHIKKETINYMKM